MKKIIFILLLIQSTFAFAGWTLLSSSEGNDKIYIDMSTLRKVDGYVEIWTLMDLDKPMDGSSLTKNIPIQSFKERLRISCSDEKLKTLVIVDYSENMGRGNVINRLDEGKWRYPIPDSVLYPIFRKVCR